MKKATLFVAAACGLLSISPANAQTTVFSDNFQNGSTLNGTSTPGGTPTASSTSYDIAASKASSSSISGSGLAVGLTASTTSGFWEAQAVFSSSPVTLGTVGDYINLTYTFTDTGGLLFSTNSAIYSGLYDSAGTTPVAGGLASSGLNTTAGSGFATGNAASWSGYVGRFLANAGNQQLYSRPVQNGTGTTSANQDLIGNNFGAGAYNNPSGTSGGNAPSTLILTSGNQYTISYLLTLTAANQLTISENLFSGITATGTALGGATNAFSSVTDLNFSGLAIGARNSGLSANPQMTVNQITVTDSIQLVPEPSTIALAGIGMGLTLLARFRRR